MVEILTRRNLPHWYRPGASFFVTYRLAGTLPQRRWKGSVRFARDSRKRTQPLVKRGLNSEFGFTSSGSPHTTNFWIGTKISRS